MEEPLHLLAKMFSAYDLHLMNTLNYRYELVDKILRL